MNQLDTFRRFYGSRSQLKVIWGHRGQVIILALFLHIKLSMDSCWMGDDTNSFDMPRLISTKPGHKNPWPMTFKLYDHSGVKGYVGVTMVKKLITQRMLQLL